MLYSLISRTFSLVAIISVVALGCSDRSNHSTSGIKIAYVAKLKNESFHEGIAKGIREEAIQQGVDVTMYYGRDQQDLAGQRQYLAEILQSGQYKGVMLAPNDSQALVEDVKKLDDAGIVFILIDTPLSETESTSHFQHDCGFVGTNNILAGKLAGQFVAGQISRGNILLVRGNHQHQSSIDREEGFVEEIKKHVGLKLLPQVVGWWEESAAYSAYVDHMKYNNKVKVDAVFAYNDPMALGVARYYDKNPEKFRPIIVGVDGVLLGQRGVLERKLSASVVQSPEVMGKIGLKNLMRCLTTGNASQEKVLTPVTLLKASMTLETMSAQ